MNRSLLLAALAAVLVFTPVALIFSPMSAFAGPMGPGPGVEEDMPMGGRHFERMAERLGLSDAQKEQIAALREAARKQAEPLLQQRQESREAMQKLVGAETFDEAAVRKLADKQARTQTELMVIRARTHSQINAVLTPEQRQLAEKCGPPMGRQDGKGGPGCKDCRGPRTMR